MTKSTWREIRAKRVAGDPESEERIRNYGAVLELHERLAELRERRGVTQTDLAHELGVGQRNVSRIEHTDDLRLSTLAGYLTGLGARLEVHAVFDDEDVLLTRS